MFELVAMLFFVSHGVVDKDPIRAYKANMQFPIEESCKAYLETKDGKAIKTAFNDAVKETKGKIRAKFACIEVEDNSF